MWPHPLQFLSAGRSGPSVCTKAFDGCDLIRNMSFQPRFMNAKYTDRNVDPRMTDKCFNRLFLNGTCMLVVNKDGKDILADEIHSRKAYQPARMSLFDWVENPQYICVVASKKVRSLDHHSSSTNSNGVWQSTTLIILNKYPFNRRKEDSKNRSIVPGYVIYYWSPTKFFSSGSLVLINSWLLV